MSNVNGSVAKLALNNGINDINNTLGVSSTVDDIPAILFCHWKVPGPVRCVGSTAYIEKRLVKIFSRTKKTTSI